MTKPPAFSPHLQSTHKRFMQAAVFLAATFLLTGCMDRMPPAPSWSPWGGGEPVLAPVELSAWLPVQSDEEASVLSAQLERASTTVEGRSPISATLAASESGNLDRVLRSENPPDLFEVDLFRLPALVADRRLASIPPELSGGDDFLPLLADAATVDGLAYCLPKDANALGLFYNQDLFDAAGIAYPTTDWTWADLRSAAEAISGLPTVKFTAFGLVLGDDVSRWLPFLLQAGGVWNVDRAELAGMTSAVGQALTVYDGLLSDGYAVLPDYYGNSWSGPDFGNGRVGMAIEGNWLAPYLAAEYPDVRYGVAPLPDGPGGPGTLVFGTCYAVSAESPHPVEAFVLIAELAGEAAMRERLAVSAAFPARAALISEWGSQYPELSALRGQLDDAVVWQASDATATLLPELRGLLRDVIAGDLTIEEALVDYGVAVQAIGD